jgi:hypothetical protein
MEKETLEEAAEKWFKEIGGDASFMKAIEFGIKFQQEQMFDIMQQYASFCVKCDREKLPLLFAKEWFEQFKNK